MYATTTFHFVSLFSFRALQANAQTARTLPCPTPAGIKMALLAKLLERDGSDRAQEWLNWLGPLEVHWRPPEQVAVTTATVRFYKSDKPDVPLTPTVGMREYAHAQDSFGLCIGPVPEQFRDDLTYALEHLRALGNAESLVQPMAPPVWQENLPARMSGFVALNRDTVEQPAEGYAVVLDDLGSAPSWERLNVFRVPDRKLIPRIGADRVRRIVSLPFDIERWTETGYVLSLLPGSAVQEEEPT